MKHSKLIEFLKQPENYMVQAGGEYEIISEIGFLRSISKYGGKNLKMNELL